MREGFNADYEIWSKGAAGPVTAIDLAVDKMLKERLRAARPDFGWLSEETADNAERLSKRRVFVVDPIDGTRAFIRRQSHGITTMVALVDQGEVISAYVGDISSDEVYGYRPGSWGIHRITNLDSFEPLDPAAFAPKAIGEVNGLLRDPLEAYGAETRALVRGFNNYEIMGSSIGAWAARLWKGEVSALLMPPGFETPWDSTPIIGISRKLGCVWLKPEAGQWVVYEPELPLKNYRREHDALIVHSSCVKDGRLAL